MDKSPESFTFTVGKLDAGMAILLGERAHLIEFPSILLPPGATTGSIVNIAVDQNVAEEKRRDSEFWALQDEILKSFGQSTPEHPKLELRNITQTSVTLEWPPIKLATAHLRSLDIYRNGQRLASIPSPHTNTSTKLSGLEINSEYSFQLILRTTAGTFPSNIIRARTHTMSDTSGISVCFGNVQDSIMLENAKIALNEMKAKWSDKIQIDTTHFVCTTPATTPSGAQPSGSAGGAPGVEYQRALQLSIPVVQPHWILACHSEKKMVPISGYYLGTTPSAPASAPASTRPQSMSQASLSRSPPLPSNNAGHRASMPAPRRRSISPPATSAFVNQPPVGLETQSRTRFEPTPEEDIGDDGAEEVQLEKTISVESKRKSRSGTMNKNFKFPSPTPPIVSGTTTKKAPPPLAPESLLTGDSKPAVITPSSVEVPPPPVEKEITAHDGEDDVGPTEEISLN